MAAIKFVNADERNFVAVNSEVSSDTVNQASTDDLAGTIFVHHPGTDEDPQLFEVIYPPGASVSPHAHEQDEIIAVVEGSMEFGKRSFGAGSSVLIPKYTLYAFRAGPNGVRFLNFRPQRASQVIWKDELARLRKADGPTELSEI